MKNSARGSVDPFIVMDVMEAASKIEKAGLDVIHLEVGQPGTSVPILAKERVIDSLLGSTLGYTVALGIPELRKKIANLYWHWYKVKVDHQRIIVTPGSSGAFILAFTGLFDVGDAVGIGSPGYPSYRQILKALSLNTVTIKALSNNKFQPVPTDVINNKLDGLLVASPANPTGSMLNRDELEKLMEACKKKETAFISDEIYHGIEYETRAVSALEVSDDCFVINSFSKYFSMTGWRLGWIVVPNKHIRQFERLAQNMFICAPHISQIAALGALDSYHELNQNVETYKTNRAMLAEQLPKLGLANFAPPDGAFYFYVDVSEYTDNSVNFANDILDQVSVAVTPGIDFDPDRGLKTIRLSYACSTPDLKEGLRRLNNFMSKYRL
ncbi:aminotransferase class I/II-fold pyridoxal phosphate-dependent enzyme [Paracoccaceae bacterium]|nr:aminotransferase class I/II-fold pyridoxal phosphate-dependent enzyme [Paracoccaceae bacterium]